MTTSEIKTSKFMVIPVLAAIMVFGAIAPSIIPASASHDEGPFDVEIIKDVVCDDAVQKEQLNCSVSISRTGADQVIIVETIPAGMEYVEDSLIGDDCTIEASNANGKTNGKSKGVGSTKITCLWDADESISFEIESRETKNGKWFKPTSCGEDAFEVNGGVDAFATDGEGNLLLVQLHDEDGNPIDGDGNPVEEGEYLVPVIAFSTEPVYVDVECVEEG